MSREKGKNRGFKHPSLKRRGATQLSPPKRTTGQPRANGEVLERGLMGDIYMQALIDLGAKPKYK